MELSYTCHDECGKLILGVGDLYCFVFLFLHVLFFLFHLYCFISLFKTFNKKNIFFKKSAVLAHVCIGN